MQRPAESPRPSAATGNRDTIGGLDHEAAQVLRAIECRTLAIDCSCRWRSVRASYLSDSSRQLHEPMERRGRDRPLPYLVSNCRGVCGTGVRHGKLVEEAAIAMVAAGILGHFRGPMPRWSKDELSKGQFFCW